jgi:hypothetical protein
LDRLPPRRFLLSGLLRRGPHLEIGLLTFNEDTRPALERFRKDHAKEFSSPRTTFAVVLGIASFIALLCLLEMRA